MNREKYPSVSTEVLNEVVCWDLAVLIANTAKEGRQQMLLDEDMLTMKTESLFQHGK